jgi:hypothetical protein
MSSSLRTTIRSSALAIIMLLLINPAFSLDIPFVFTKDTAGLENLSSEQIMSLYNTSPDLAKMPPLTEDRTTEDYFRTIFEEKICQDGNTTHRIANEIIKGHTGDLTIDQIFTIYDYLRYGRNGIGGWYYVSEPLVMINESDAFNSASETLKLGESMSFTGSGDCDDFAIVMASLVRAIGGTVRVIAVEDDGKLVHAYSEVYLGCLNETDDEIYYLVQLLMIKYRIDKIYTHIDPLSKDVWLNLDTPLNLGDRAYPGIPYSLGSDHHKITDLSIGTRQEVKAPEYRSLINIVNESMNSPDALNNLSKIDENVLIFKQLAERSGLNASEIPSTNELLDTTFNMLGSYGLFDLDMAKLAYGNTSFIPNSSANSTYLVFDLNKMRDMIQDSNASALGVDPFSNLSAVMNDSMIVQDGKSMPLSTVFDSLGLKVK